jgi:hypothetical protein
MISFEYFLDDEFALMVTPNELLFERRSRLFRYHIQYSKTIIPCTIEKNQHLIDRITSGSNGSRQYAVFVRRIDMSDR